MIDRATAERIALGALQAAMTDGTEIALVDAATREESFGWIFFYQDKEFLEGRVAYGLAGNVPLVVLRSGRALYLPWRYVTEDIEEAIRRLDAQWGTT